MPKPAFERGQYYNQIKEAINQERILNISFPGTGGEAEDAFPHRIAVQSIINSGRKAVITFAGLGTDWDESNPNPAPGNTLSIEPKSRQAFLRHRDSIFAVSAAEGPFITSVSGVERSYLPKLGGSLFGYGLNSSVELMINMLKSLEGENNLPASICLSGHSRGAVTCFVLANRIWEEFGAKIKLNIAATDPVPGPQLKSDYAKYVIPPNVESLTAVYATAGQNNNLGTFIDKQFIALEPQQFVVPNPQTKITCLAVPDTDHISITDNRLAVIVMNAVIKAVNGIGANLRPIAAITPDNMQGRGARKDISYYRLENAANENTFLDNAIRYVRSHIVGYQLTAVSNQPQDHFSGFRCHASLSSYTRYNYLLRLHKNGISHKRTSSTEDYEAVMKMRTDIINGAKMYSDSNYNINIGGYFSGKKYITAYQSECLTLIDRESHDRNHDPYSVYWKSIRSELNVMRYENLAPGSSFSPGSSFGF